MTDDLVERLRRDAPYANYPPLLSEAADAILKLQGEVAEARAANEFDRTTIIDARNAIHDEIVRRSWVLEGRGSYEWDDDRYRDEFKAALEAIGKPLEILQKLGINWAHCPTDSKAIAAARIDYKPRLEAAEAEVARMREALELLTRAVENMRVPQNIAEAAWQVEITIGPAVKAARAALQSLQPGERT